MRLAHGGGAPGGGAPGGRPSSRPGSAPSGARVGPPRDPITGVRQVVMDNPSWGAGPVASPLKPARDDYVPHQFFDPM